MRHLIYIVYWYCQYVFLCGKSGYVLFEHSLIQINKEDIGREKDLMVVRHF